MNNFLNKLFFLSLVGFFATSFVAAQETGVLNDNLFETFKRDQQSHSRLDFFFRTPNRYRENSAYDWLDQVNIYLLDAQKKNDSSAILDYLLMQSQVYHDLGDYDKSIAISKDLYEEKEELGLKTKEILLNLMDQSYGQLKFYSDQIDIRKEKRELGLTENISFYDIYANLGFYRKAMDDYFQEEKKKIDESDYYGQAVFYNTVGDYLRLDKSAPTALIRYNKAAGFINVFLSDTAKSKSENEMSQANLLKGIIEGNIGKCHALMEQYEEAVPFLERSIETIKEEISDKFSSELVENSLTIAECYLELEDFEKATDYLSNSLTPVKTENIVKRNQLYASYYDKTQDYKNSIHYLKKNIRIADSLKTNESKLRLQQLGTVVGEDKNNTLLMMEQQRLELEQSKNDMIALDERNDMAFILLVLTLLALAGLVYAYLRSIKNQRLIAEQKHIIENSLVEKDSLLKEIHHRVKNNLQMVSSLLSLQTKNTRSKAAIEALEEGKSRVKAMALIHQKLYQNEDLSVIEMQGYIESLINSVQSVYKKGGHNINITVDAEGVELDIDRAIPFGLILNELVSNSFKYAFPTDDENGKIYIHLRKIGVKEGFFEYTDNGVGLPEDSEERANSSMGIRLMNRLANQLQTKLNVDNKTEGVRFWFNFT
ncbi:histidine kinase [Flavobacteriaceae bacterium TP-CH-4]|uniref:histidine kinase n=1 Tax=Pelagihabitans pacificus TaxID=2696054 RepID=A0A967AZ67_9FLAO|nr:histidine kinase dimerization/phosphoacceptor domain -containing protein [Pelagihabitans pacificus]NHF59231.1 histidine kinase [Pelagihabitans pacificus]